MAIYDNIKALRASLPDGVKLVAVSKYHPFERIVEAYEAGLRDFGENRPQELQKKVIAMREWLGSRGLEDDVRWHFLGHLQTNKLKMVLPYASLVQSVDSLHLLQEINAWSLKNNIVTDVLLEMHIAAEESKQGFVEEEVLEIMFANTSYRGVRICGLMGMASHVDDEAAIDADFSRIEDFFHYLKDLFPELECFRELSIGMSSDWKLAVSHSASIVRIGTAIFGDKE